MKRLSSPTPSERGFPTVLDELELDDDECGEELCSGGGGGEKKRRLRVEQVRALEKNFEVENKLDPDRKVRLAHELGLQPRQVAVWFQNRRARWKTKQLERDYAALKANYDALRLDFDALQHDNHSIAAKIKEVKAKLGGGRSSVKEAEVNPPEINEVKANLGAGSSSVKEAEVNPPEIKAEMENAPTLIYNKDGSSDSDSSAVINEVSSSTTFGFTPASSWSPFAAPEPRVHKGGWLGFSFQQQLMKAEEHGFLAGDEPCSSAFFSDEQPPAFTWGGPDQWCWTDGRGQE